mmetsp:Transcript_24939/g.53783  ORF Transcript_24939/g.53783 Transcript_24939/m.53783 type:complete len:1285 (-) Transcript_24939:139-3993(-)|eukprot:CAMPEP_0172307672 /NCGR_PEP_ID=MMETSP1058-20130122/8476_1 /TAXON_ID=83371 /ORGANISM="Detonula confervacea, Strain CCMP 353" /LENGTH=1284 /DNA_ID=CAMNT_0013019903 /DNA_START=76 /DNA_END=3930 /DNA_ORIENTATION=+
MNCPLSPTTKAATSGLKLNDPLLNRNITISTNNNAATDISNGANSNGRDNHDDDTETTTTSAHNVNARHGRMMEKENRQPFQNAHDAESFHPLQQQPMQQQDELSKEPSQSRKKGLIRNGANANTTVLASTIVDAAGGVRLTYFDETNVMNGAAAIGEKDFLTSDRIQYFDHANDNVDNNNATYNEDENDSYSEASGDTVVHNDCPAPPPNATREELKRHYWEWCYGPDSIMKVQAVGSVVRVPPKSCLSTRKKRTNSDSNRKSMTPRRILHHSPDDNNNNNEEDVTPKNNMTRTILPTMAQHQQQQQSAVKFGNNTAAEFDFHQPATKMTPIPPSIVQEIFPCEIKHGEKEMEEEGVSRETARNVALLAEWEDDFDDFIQEDGEGEDVMKDGVGGRKGRKRGGTPYKHGSGGRGRRSGSAGRPRKNRRDSSIFSRERKSLIDPIDDCMEDANDDDVNQNNDGSNGRGNSNRDDVGHLLPFSVTIDPNEYTSPSSSSMNVSNDSISTLGTTLDTSPAAAASLSKNDANDVDPNYSVNEKMLLPTTTNVRKSLDSACISPSSLKSSLSTTATDNSNSSLQYSISSNEGVGSSSNDNESSGNDSGRRTSSDDNTVATGKETPNSARTSSSTILRAVHASGALSSPSDGVASNGVGGVGGGGNTNRLQPNQLKYSPSGSSSGCSSISTARMDTSSSSSPSDSESLGSDIMGLFTTQSLDGIDSPNKNSPIIFQLGRQLSLLSAAHQPTTSQLSMRDLIQCTEKDPLVFMKEHLLRGLSVETSLALILAQREGIENDDSSKESNDGNSNESLFCGNSKWLQSALLDNEKKSAKSSSSVQKNFEAMLLQEIKELCSDSSSQSFSKRSTTKITMTDADADLHTISLCIQQFHNVACEEWSDIEVDTAMRALSKLQEWAKVTENETEERDNFVTSCCKKLMEMSTMTMQALANKSNDNDNAATIPTTSNKSNLTQLQRKRKAQSQRKDELTSQIQALENELATESISLQQAKRAKRIFNAHLEIERCNPMAAAVTEEIRTEIVPGPAFVTTDASDFTFKLLDGSAEIVMKIASDNDECDNDNDQAEATEQLGCFIKDDGEASIKLLQALLLGTINKKALEDENNKTPLVGPFPLRESLSSMILENECQEEASLQMTHLFSRMDMLVRSVRELETNDSFCTVNNGCGANGDDDVVVSVSMHPREGTVVQIIFLFPKMLSNDWLVTTVPDSVKVSIVSTVERGGKMSLIGKQLQEKAQSILLLGGPNGSLSNAADPILLRRICVELMALMDSM